ncbi:hypothetical protein 4 [Wuchang romanomermis nematode virus 2]|uniref:C3H1-type domain-containing protein n=1 Tax=Wuchang romanomermis nematode virus 2 TaxID=2773460 RepID=A0A1L3KMZ4_9MONO|nr:hypothetical protein 4 [Wuchang romanomermis nematode virus 2]APG78781.1 hypothetical protein 4 [Wuchang romanomermis nematode virus 2]
MDRPTFTRRRSSSVGPTIESRPTVPCKYWEDSHICMNGASCRFAHNDYDPTPLDIVRHLDFMVGIMNKITERISRLEMKVSGRSNFQQQGTLQQRASRMLAHSNRFDRRSRYHASPSSAVSRMSQRDELDSSQPVQTSFRTEPHHNPFSPDLMGQFTPQIPSFSYQQAWEMPPKPFVNKNTQIAKKIAEEKQANIKAMLELEKRLQNNLDQATVKNVLKNAGPSTDSQIDSDKKQEKEDMKQEGQSEF